MICNVNAIGNVKMQLLFFTALVKLKQTHSKSCIRAGLKLSRQGELIPGIIMETNCNTWCSLPVPTVNHPLFICYLNTKCSLGFDVTFKEKWLDKKFRD